MLAKSGNRTCLNNGCNSQMQTAMQHPSCADEEDSKRLLGWPTANATNVKRSNSA